MPLVQDIENYEIFPVSTYAEYIPSMSEHKRHLEWLEKTGFDKFDSGLDYEKVELKRLRALININFKKHGDVRGIAILKRELKDKQSEGM